MRRRHHFNMAKTLFAVCCVGALLASCAPSSHRVRSIHHTAQQTSLNQTPQAPNTNQTVPDSNPNGLANLNYVPGHSAIVQVNGGHSTLNINDWKHNHVAYQQLDSLNRTSGTTTAYLEKRNVANDSLRVRQTVVPTGWHQKRNGQGEMILNRGHIIAYSLSKGIGISGSYNPLQRSGDQNNPRNLFTQTAFCNQELQTIYEQQVRQALRKGAKVIYQVQPIFQGNDLMAKGVHLQAVGSNGLNFNVYLFNVQPGFRFNYANGTSVVDQNMQVPTPPNAPHFHDQH